MEAVELPFARNGSTALKHSGIGHLPMAIAMISQLIGETMMAIIVRTIASGLIDRRRPQTEDNAKGNLA